MINWLMTGFFMMVPLAQAGLGEMPTQRLAKDCYQEWQTRGWTVGEDGTPAADLANFRSGIELICQVRAELFNENTEISPYIQESMREIAPFILTADKADIRDYILSIEKSGRVSPRDPYLRP